MVIETDNGPVVINQAAFDPKTMKLAKEAGTQSVAVPAPAVEASKPATPPADTNTGTPDPAPAPTQQMLVTKKGKKFLVVDENAKAIERDGIDASGYSSEADAWAAIMALQG